MSSYFNAEGEPLMTASEARFEAYLDADADPGDPDDNRETAGRHRQREFRLFECDDCESAIEADADYQFCPYCGSGL